MAVQIILCVISAALIVGAFLLALFASWRIRLDRHLKHDVANQVAVVRLAHHVGNEDDVDAHLSTLCAYLRPGMIARVKLRRFVKSVASLVALAHECKIDVYAPDDIEITVMPGELHRALTNALINAAEARRQSRDSALVQIKVRGNSLVIINPANKRDRRTVITTDRGSTRSKSRGSGRESIRRCCERMGWRVEYAVSGRAVITTLRWDVARCYAGDGRAEDVQQQD